MKNLMRSIALGSLLLPVIPVGAVTTTTTTVPRPSTTTTSTMPAAADADHDGVVDLKDKCPATPAGEKVDKDGCSVGQLCPCAAPRAASAWKSHGEYVSCLRKALNAFVKAKILTKKTASDALVSGPKSQCGVKSSIPKNRVRCCRPAPTISAKPFCMQVSKTSCKKLHGTESGTGSCLPNPCN